ncbi:endonuclease/exonuclease/phosphatase family protein [Sphingobacterium sp. IITKGP-BTPF85]|uniref:endonuclease/exonuclease/phosphatase family protein n=1 Tax=Sphingobacterium sp. IITKGP-BTPF85 TaxID=1338009 RepID=UPI00038A1C9D|nr:endonuclease/exonuclease/phosphatase family protein [Sphingobacterium sp. IITKGP-BTPF85]KKX48007.1 endonuclease/exonuclease/phosphatase [Sphingobacterium sp. IITKGP-BTPF85]
MKTRYIKTMLCLMISAVTLTAQAQKMRVATYNLRYDTPNDSLDRWQNRVTPIAQLIQFHEFDIFGTQEALKNQLDDLSKQLPQFERYGLGRDDGKAAGEHAAIYYKKDRFELVSKGDFWLSETPDRPSLGWDAPSNIRICTWIQLKDKDSKKSFFLFNAHYDHRGILARKESSLLILKKITEIAKEQPVILMGDFNGDSNSEWYKSLATSDLLKDTYHMVSMPYALNGSSNGFRTGEKFPVHNTIIDHIFVSKHFKGHKWGILTDTYSGKFPSDHFPLLTVLEL